MSAEPHDIPADAERGCTRHLLEQAMRDMRREEGFDATRQFVAERLLELGGAKIIEHERH